MDTTSLDEHAAAVAFFAKTPGYSPVKTRLADSIGALQAESFYRLSVQAVEEIAMHVNTSSQGTVQPYWAVAEREAAQHELWARWPVLWTGAGDLGMRLHTVYQQLQTRYQHVLLMGTDSPQIMPDLILAAVTALRRNPQSCVIGPCPDGGFYLFGGSQPIPAAVWTTTKYSQHDTLAQLTAHLREAGYYYTLLPSQQDVDTLDDAQALKSTLMHYTDTLLPTQRALYEWLCSLMSS